MTTARIKYGRRSFIKSTVVAGGGLMLGFNWFTPEKAINGDTKKLNDEWFRINAYLKVNSDGKITIMSPNPEIGQNVKTSMPMIVADELDADWKKVIVEQAPLDTRHFRRQLAGGSDSIRTSWTGLRMAGAAARLMLITAAASRWNVPLGEVSASEGIIYHKPGNKKGTYGEFASDASRLPVPDKVTLKEIKNFGIIGTSRKNVDGLGIVTGKPLFGLDYRKDGMITAMIVHPPAFGLRLKSFEATEAKKMPGIRDVFSIKVYNDDYKIQWSDTSSFTELVAVAGNSTWEVMKAKSVLKCEWEPISDRQITMQGFRGDSSITVPAGLESTAEQISKMKLNSSGKVVMERRDGDPEEAFKKASRILERTYTAPFLAHNTMEPMNFFADVTDDKAILTGPIQSPEYMAKTVAARLGLPSDKVEINMTRIGGGFGRRLYGHFMVEAAVISQKLKTPVKLVYSREDDMTDGIYRPAYHAIYRAAIDSENNVTAFHVRMGGIPETALHPNRFPAGAFSNYLAESWLVPSNISVGAMRAPGSNFNAAAEQSFLDELAEAVGKDPIEFRLALLKRAKENPVGKNNDYDPVRYAGVLELVREKSGWDREKGKGNRGVAAYFCHNSYSAHVLDIVMENGEPRVNKVYSANDCGIVVNPDAAANMVEGSIVDGIGTAMYGGMTFTDGKPDYDNFDNYRMIRHNEAPKEISVFFVENDISPTGLGEPPYPPVFAALANALYKATGKRYYHQPYKKNRFE